MIPRGKPIDAVILGIFVTLSHVSGIVLIGVLASLGSAWLQPQRIEAYLAVVVGSQTVQHLHLDEAALVVACLRPWALLWNPLNRVSPDPSALGVSRKTTSCIGAIITLGDGQL